MGSEQACRSGASPREVNHPGWPFDANEHLCGSRGRIQCPESTLVSRQNFVRQRQPIGGREEGGVNRACALCSTHVRFGSNVGSRAHTRCPEGTLSSSSRKFCEAETANQQAGRSNKGFAPLLLHFIVGVSGVMLDLQVGAGHQIEYANEQVGRGGGEWPDNCLPGLRRGVVRSVDYLRLACSLAGYSPSRQPPPPPPNRDGMEHAAKSRFLGFGTNRQPGLVSKLVVGKNGGG
jgi:hypothetical protein